MALCRGIMEAMNQRPVKLEAEVEPLSPMARMFSAPGTNCVIVAVFGFKTRIDVEAFKHGLQLSLVKHPRFCSKLVFDSKNNAKPVGWTRTKVNIHDHIIALNLDPNMESPDQFVEDYVSDISKNEMDMSNLLWEFHLLDIKTSEATSIGIFRFHHSLGDGISLISLLLACSRSTSSPDSFPNLPVAKKKLKERSNYRLLRYFSILLLIFKVLWNTLVDIAIMMATTIYLKDTKFPWETTPSVEPAQKRFVHRNLSFDDIKFVKNAMNMTVNDVVLGITQSGLACYLNRKYGKDSGHKALFKNNLPKHIRVRAIIMMNLRPSVIIEGLVEMMKSDFKGKWEWGNLIGYAILPFHILLREDPLDYIRKAKSTIDRKKQSLQVWFSYYTNKFLLSTIGLQATVDSVSHVLSNTTLTFSNLAGPAEEISLCGHPIVFFAPSVSGILQGLMVHFQSYMDKMTVVLGVDENVFPDPHKLCDEIEESLTRTRKSVIEKKLDSQV